MTDLISSLRESFGAPPDTSTIKGIKSYTEFWISGEQGAKGIVIDAFARVALVGIELVAIEARAVIASVETWLKYAEAIGLTVDPASA